MIVFGVDKKERNIEQSAAECNQNSGSGGSSTGNGILLQSTSIITDSPSAGGSDLTLA